MHPPDADTVVCRYGDLGVKSGGVRDRMEERLCDNLRALLADRGRRTGSGGRSDGGRSDGGPPGAVERRWSRPLIRTSPEHVAACRDAAADCFGVVSASAAVAVDPKIPPITDALAAAAPAVYGGEGSFAVRARRAGEADVHPFTSEDIEEAGGSAVWAAVEDAGGDPAVDLDDPDAVFEVDCRSDEAYVFTDRADGPGGLPLGTQAPLVALVSGGIDSPVAAWEAMRRGSPVRPLYVDLGDYGGPDHRARAEETVRRLRRYAPNEDLALRVAPAGDAVERLVEATAHDRMLHLRRFMLRVAAHVARDEGCAGLVTGEALGQKSSQTAANVRVVDEAVDLPVHRPLLARDKQWIVDRAKAIGTFDDATIDAGCVRVAPDQPVTAADPGVVLDNEPDWLAEAAADIAGAVERVPLTDRSGAASGDGARSARGTAGDGAGEGDDGGDWEAEAR